MPVPVPMPVLDLDPMLVLVLVLDPMPVPSETKSNGCLKRVFKTGVSSGDAMPGRYCAGASV